MSDPRATSRGSKIAAVVMLVVFLQVLVVAMLGLGAIDRDRQEARRSAERASDREAEDTLDSLLASAGNELSHALEDMRTRTQFEELARLRDSTAPGRHTGLVNTVYQVDSETGPLVIYWMDGVHVLYRDAAARRRAIADEERDDAVAISMDAQVRDEQQKEAQIRDDKERSDAFWKRLPSALRYYRRFPYRLDHGYPRALGDVSILVTEAEEDLSLHPPDAEHAEDRYLDFQEILLTALEIAFANQDRESAELSSDRDLLETVPKDVRKAVLSLQPEDRSEDSRARQLVEAIRRQVEACLDARNQLETKGLVDVLNLARRGIGDAADFFYLDPWLVGRLPDVTVPLSSSPFQAQRNLLVLMNVKEAKYVVEHTAETEDAKKRLDRLGLALHVAAARDKKGEAVAATRRLEDVPDLRLPFRAELWRVGTPALPAEGPGALFYWGIIALSAAGLGIGGWVLMRLYTREVRLARLKADFVSNLSHELKTPLTSIGMFTEMLQDGQLQSEEDRQEGFQVLAQESERLQGIVHRMLDAAKREARGVPYELTPGDLSAVAGKAAERFQRILKEPGLDLAIELDPQPLWVRMDRAAIDDVVSNLVSNAWKYRREDTVHIRVRTARRGRKAELVISDDGLGIPRRERRKVFEMFYRAEAYLTRAAGTGLGLSLVRTIVRAHGGSVRIEAGEGGVGTTFRIRIPLDRKSEPGQDPASVPLTNLSAKSEAQATS